MLPQAAAANTATVLIVISKKQDQAGGQCRNAIIVPNHISRAAKLQSREESSAKPPLLAALTDGEDFELLFTVASRAAVPLLDAWKAQFPDVKLSCIGKISAAPGLRLRDERGLREFNLRGYEHFTS